MVSKIWKFLLWAMNLKLIDFKTKNMNHHLLKPIFSVIFLGIAIVSFSQNNYKFLVGTYTQGTKSEGIYSLILSDKGKLESIKLLAKTDNPSYLAFSPDKKYVYAANETGKESAVSAFRFDKENESLTFLNSLPVTGNPCHLSCSDKHVITANYSGGSISVFERGKDGLLSEKVQEIVQPKKNFGNNHFGMSNVHQVLFSPDSSFLMVTNLGSDHVYTYVYHPDSANNVLEEKYQIKVQKGSGPRHLVFTRNGRYLYLVQELNGGITVFSATKDGKLNIIQETTLITDRTKKFAAAEIALSPDEKFLYASDRIETNNITCFKVSKENGTLSFVEQVYTDGVNPRFFTLTNDGKYIIVGNQQTNNIVIFQRNRNNGKLKKINEIKGIDAPVCFLAY